MGNGREFSFEEKLKFVFYYKILVDSWMKISKKALTKWVNVKLDTLVSQMTIARVLKEKDPLTTFDVGDLDDSKCIRLVQCLKVEQHTFSWFTTI